MAKPILVVQPGGLNDKKKHCFSLSVLWLLGKPEFSYKVTSIQFAHNEQRQVERQFLPQEYQAFFKVKEQFESFLNIPGKNLSDWVSRALLSSAGQSVLLVQQYRDLKNSDGFSHCLAIKPTNTGGFEIFDTSFEGTDRVFVDSWSKVEQVVLKIITLHHDAQFQLCLLSTVQYSPN